MKFACFYLATPTVLPDQCLSPDMYLNKHPLLLHIVNYLQKCVLLAFTYPPQLSYSNKQFCNIMKLHIVDPLPSMQLLDQCLLHLPILMPHSLNFVAMHPSQIPCLLTLSHLTEAFALLLIDTKSCTMCQKRKWSCHLVNHQCLGCGALHWFDMRHKAVLLITGPIPACPPFFCDSLSLQPCLLAFHSL